MDGEKILNGSREQVSRSKIRAVPCERGVRFEGDKVDCENSRVSPDSSLLGTSCNVLISFLKRLRTVFKIYQYMYVNAR